MPALRACAAMRSRRRLAMPRPPAIDHRDRHLGRHGARSPACSGRFRTVAPSDASAVIARGHGGRHTPAMRGSGDRAERHQEAREAGLPARARRTTRRSSARLPCDERPITMLEPSRRTTCSPSSRTRQHPPCLLAVRRFLPGAERREDIDDSRAGPRKFDADEADRHPRASPVTPARHYGSSAHALIPRRAARDPPRVPPLGARRGHDFRPQRARTISPAIVSERAPLRGGRRFNATAGSAGSRGALDDARARRMFGVRRPPRRVTAASRCRSQRPCIRPNALRRVWYVGEPRLECPNCSREDQTPITWRFLHGRSRRGTRARAVATARHGPNTTKRFVVLLRRHRPSGNGRAHS